jgi:hypothetical protein
MSCSFVHVLILCAASLAPHAGNAEISRPPRDAGLPTGRALSARNLVDALRAAGATVKQEGPVEQPFFAVPARAINVNGEGVQVFEYPHAVAADAQAATVSRDGSQVGASKPFWIGAPHFYKKANLLVLYLGDDEKVLKLLQSVLGQQFAGR